MPSKRSRSKERERENMSKDKVMKGRIAAKMRMQNLREKKTAGETEYENTQNEKIKGEQIWQISLTSEPESKKMNERIE